MEYKLIKIDKKHNSILITAGNVQLWIDYFFDGELGYTWEFNEYIFNIYNSKDIEVQETQKKIYEDVENFNCFMDEILMNI